LELSSHPLTAFSSHFSGFFFLACLQLWLLGCTTVISSPDGSGADVDRDVPQAVHPASAVSSTLGANPTSSSAEVEVSPGSHLKSISPQKQPTTPSSVAQSPVGSATVGSRAGSSGPVTQPRSSSSSAEVPQQDNQAEADLKALRLAYARLVQEMGTADEREKVRELLAREIDDSSLPEYMVSLSLAEGDYDTARYWLAQANARRQRLPAWQRLALALTDDDLEAIRRILDEPDSKLTATDRLQALQRLGLDSQALALAHELLESDSSVDDSSELRQQADALALKLANRFALGGEILSFGPLDITTATALLDLQLENARAGIKVAGNQLDYDPDELSVNKEELDIALKAGKPWHSDQLEILLGGNLREDNSIPYGGFKWDHQFERKLLGRLQLSVNQISNETPAFRVVGAKDLLSLGLFANLTSWEFARTQLKVQRYHTRDGDELAHGFAVEGALESFLLKKSPAWLVRLQGSWESNELEENLPPGLTPTILPPSAVVETIVPSEYGSLGFGTTVQYGVSGEETIRAYQGLIDAWVGWVWPSKELGYNFRLGAGISPLGKDMLSINAFYSNTQGGRTDQAYQGIVVQYSYRF
jgi:hypothetical protein